MQTDRTTFLISALARISLTTMMALRFVNCAIIVVLVVRVQLLVALHVLGPIETLRIPASVRAGFMMMAHRKIANCVKLLAPIVLQLLRVARHAKVI